MAGMAKHTRARASAEAIANRVAGQRAAREAREAETAPLQRTMTLDKFAKIIGVSGTTVYERGRRDELPVPVIFLGTRMFVSTAAVEKLLSAEKPREIPTRFAESPDHHVDESPDTGPPEAPAVTPEPAERRTTEPKTAPPPVAARSRRMAQLSS